ncbi:unnamed protein product [Boreogadus saida]
MFITTRPLPARKLNQNQGPQALCQALLEKKPATQSTCRTPISEMGDTWLDSQEDTLKGTREKTRGRDLSQHYTRVPQRS